MIAHHYWTHCLHVILMVKDTTLKTVVILYSMFPAAWEKPHRVWLQTCQQLVVCNFRKTL